VRARPRVSGVLWDTMFASRIRPSRPEALEAARASRGTDQEPLLSFPVVAEVVFGLRRRAAGDLAYERLSIWWERHALAGPGRFRVVAPSVASVVLAARLRARQPTSPAKARRTDGRKDPERRVSWSRDIELAAIAATSGLPLATENKRDFAAIAALLGEVAPRLPLDLRASVFS
jgi:predicted nucleic acid-binding protein